MPFDAVTDKYSFLPFPYLGNMSQAPRESPFLYATEWLDTYNQDC